VHPEAVEAVGAVRPVAVGAIEAAVEAVGAVRPVAVEAVGAMEAL
jgi:hypothetical protein